jgi:hypothetical protein
MSGTQEEHAYQALIWAVSSLTDTDWSQLVSALVRHWGWALAEQPKKKNVIIREHKKHVFETIYISLFFEDK